MRVWFLVLIATVAFSAFSQGLTFKAKQDLHGQDYANIWGYTDQEGREYALVGCNSGTAIVNVTDPANPLEITFIQGATSIWHEIQVWDHYAYVVSEGGRGVQIIDLSNLPTSAVLVNEFTTPSYSNTHDIQIRDGYAYLTGGNTTSNGGIKILSLADPVHPVEVGNFNQTYIHDCYVRNDTIYAAAIFSGRVYVIDVKNKSNPQVVYSFTYPNGFTHNTALSDDGQILYTTDETSSPPGRLRVWDISTLRDGIDGNTNISQLTSFGSTAIVHNVFAKGRFVYASYYTEGVRIWDASTPSALNLIGSYDSYAPSNAAIYDGAWGVYPFFPSGTVVLSDITDGLIVLDFSFKESGVIKGLVTDSLTGQPIAGAKIYLLQDNLTRSSAADGSFRIKALSGNSTFKIVAPGYLPVYRDVQVPVDDSTTSDFMLNLAPPDPPTNLSAVKDSATITLKWHQSTAINFKMYRIYGDTVSEPTALIDSILTKSDTTLTLSGLTNGLTYYFRISTVNTDGLESALSSQVSAVPNPAPLNLAVIIYQNPVLTSSLDIAVSSDINLISVPSVRVSISGDTTDVTMTSIGGSASNFSGTYQMQSPGTYTLVTRGTSTRFVDSTKVRVFTASVAKPGSLSALQSSDRVARLQIGEDVVLQPSYFLSEVQSTEDGQVYYFGPRRAYTGSLRVEFAIPVTERENWFIESRNQSGWCPLPGQYILGDRVVCQVSGLGEFRLAKMAGTSNRVVDEFRLAQNYPNPFNPSTTISFELTEDEEIRLVVYNLLGQEVKVLRSGRVEAGIHEVLWDGTGSSGRVVASGIYFYRLYAAGRVTTRKMLFIK